tara:strand:+ start:2997 stop:3950 length:954 start_codon:yes stop_codon:yes gene_type:complete
MSNVFSLYQTPDIFEGTPEIIDWPVETRQLGFVDDDGGIHFSNKVAVIRGDTIDTPNPVILGVHGESYKPVAPRELLQTQREIILRSGLNTDGITERVQTSHQGAATFITYRLPEHTYTTPDGDTACLTLLGVTSLNSTFSFIISAGANQWACMNRQVFVSGSAALFKARHTKNLDMKAAARAITKSLEVFQNEQELWAEMYRTQVTAKQAMFVFAEAAGCLDLVRTIVAECGVSWSAVFDQLPRLNSSLTYLANAWNQYSDKMGKNQWAVYNTLTDWSTHAPAATQKTQANIASVNHKRQDIVRNVCNSDVFRIAA